MVARDERATVIPIKGGEIRGSADDWSLTLGNSPRYFRSLSALTRYLFERRIRLSGARTLDEILRQIKDTRSDLGILFEGPDPDELEQIESDLLS